MQILRSIAICAVRFFLVFKKTKVMDFAICANVSLPFLGNSMPRHSFQSRRIIGLNGPVKTIIGMTSFAEIGNSIVRTVSVPVVNFAIRPFSVVKRPCNTVGKNNRFVYAYYNISTAITSSQDPSFGPLGSLKPPKLSRGKIVGEFFAQIFNGNSSHEDDIVRFLSFSKEGFARG